jgi:O-antigen ligase
VAFFLGFGLVLILAVLRGQSRNQIVAGTVLLLVAGGFVVWLGAGRALDRFAAYRKLEISEARRAEMLRDSWRIFTDHPLTGTGLGTLQDVFPHYETLYDGAIVSHTHNDYVEALAETGLIGGLIGASFLTLFFLGVWKRISEARGARDLALHIGALGACGGFLAHSLVDFNLHIPSNALLFLIAAILATSTTPLRRDLAESHQLNISRLDVRRAVPTV